MWGDLYKSNPGYVLGFHGCDKDVGEAVLRCDHHLEASDNDHDWLGPGIYFWECSPARAQSWAEEAAAQPKKTKGKIKKPFVIGAIIDLGLSCNLFDSEALTELREAYEMLEFIADLKKEPMLKNVGGEDRVLRYLDCAAIQMLHAMREGRQLAAYDSVRAAFSEGKALYPGAEITERNHIQLAVKKSCIKGYFRPIPETMGRLKR